MSTSDSQQSDPIDAAWFSIAHIARELGHSRATVSNRLDAAEVRPAGTRNGYPVYALGDVWIAFNQRRAGALSPQDQLATERAKECRLNQAAKQLALNERAGQLVVRTEADQAWSNLTTAVAKFLATLPATLERDCDLSPTAVKRTRELVGYQRVGGGGFGGKV